MPPLSVPFRRLVPLLALLLSFIVVAPAGAASVELTASLKASLDKTAASADAKTAARLRTLYAELDVQLQADKKMAADIKTLKHRNEEAVLLVRKQIREIDAARIARLAAEAQQAKARYKPLLDSYASLNKRLSLARSVKSKTLVSALSFQAEAMKLPVRLAREDMKAKNDAHKAAKAAASAKIKAARDSLSAIDPLKIQIKDRRSSMSRTRAGLSPVWSNFKYALKKNDPGSAVQSLNSLVAAVKQIVADQQRIYVLEGKIASVIAVTKARHL
ncbi:hypothetical protein [Cohnella hongkongensis]|uniref:Uncharacterized protein n=1 Tax=Cohnella hongkongensis TaxID=178337 RepID=A0ABV9FD52_9BACL